MQYAERRLLKEKERLERKEAFVKQSNRAKKITGLVSVININDSDAQMDDYYEMNFTIGKNLL